MRLIDADALKLAVVEEGERSRRYKIGQTWELNRDEIWKVIDSMPTIEEHKSGEWIDFTMADFGLAMEQCGACKGWSLGMGKKFCPHCGARNMKGEQDEHND